MRLFLYLHSICKSISLCKIEKNDKFADSKNVLNKKYSNGSHKQCCRQDVWY